MTKTLTLNWAWFGPADRVHGHDARGTGSYPGLVNAIVQDGLQQYSVHMDLASGAVFEDALVRLVDLDDDSSSEVVLVAASRLESAAITVTGVERRDQGPVLMQRARSPFVGPRRWLNPVGVADFHGDSHKT